MDWLWVLIVAVRAVAPAPGDQWAARLAELDHVRERAFAVADPSMLDEIYVDGSPAHQTDARLIGAYRRRNGRVVGAELRVLSCRVLEEGRGRVRLDVVDQLAPTRVAWGDGTSTDLPRDRPTRRHVTLERADDGRWRIAASRTVDAPP